MKKICIIGCPGAGKSTFARKLKEKTNLPLFYLDQIWHRSDKSNCSKEEFDQRLHEIIHQESWIIDGNYYRTLEVRLKACDTVFLLDYPLDVCLEGAQSRIGKPREDMPWIEEEFEEEFKQWILDFPHDQLPQIYQLLKQYDSSVQVIIFHSRQEAEEYLENDLKRRKIHGIQTI